MSLRNMIRSGVLGPGASRVEEEPAEDENDDVPEEEDEAEATETDAEAADETADDTAEGSAEDDGAQASSATAIRRAERRRIQAILSCNGADQVPELAARLAFETDTDQREAAGLISAALPSTRKSGFEGRMSGTSNPTLGTGARGTGKDTPDDNLVAFAEARKARRKEQRTG